MAALSKLADREWNDINNEADIFARDDRSGPVDPSSSNNGGDLQQFLREIQTDDDQAILVKMKAILAQYEARVAQKFPEVLSDESADPKIDVVAPVVELDPLLNDRIVADEIAEALKTNVNGRGNDRYDRVSRHVLWKGSSGSSENGSIWIQNRILKTFCIMISSLFIIDPIHELGTTIQTSNF